MEQLKEEYQLPVYLFHEGKNYEAYRFFGVHKIKKGTYAFRVWAPHAVGVAVAGDFNDWSETANPMTLIAPEIWEAVVDGVSKYDCYKYAIQTADGRLLMKADPYAVHQRPDRAPPPRSTTCPATSGRTATGLPGKKKPLCWTNR